LLYIPRPDWPEEESLLQWLDGHGAAVELASECLVTGEFKSIVQRARSRTIKSPAATGATQAADYLYGLLC
jgi:hypothetical protein